MQTQTATQSRSSTLSSGNMEEFYVETFPIVARFVAKMNGSIEDAKDVFHDAVIIYIEKEERAMLQPVQDQQRYLLGIAKHIWLKKFAKAKKEIKLDEFERLLNIPNDFYAEVKTSLLLDVLETTGRKCMDMLRGFYYERLSMKSIADRHGFGSERSATVQKYKCIEKIREKIKTESLVYEDFFE